MPKTVKGEIGDRTMARQKILVVDDEQFNRDLMAQILEERYELIMAIDGQEAVDKAAQEQPHLILMDLGMPGLDGWDATRQIKANEALSHIPIIAITSHAMVGEEARAREAGCDDYMPKPVDEDALIQRIKNYLS